MVVYVLLGIAFLAAVAIDHVERSSHEDDDDD